jgi:hypothetical protein
MASSSPSTEIGQAQQPLRRLSVELFAIIVLKIAVLMLIWWVAFASHPKPDVSAGAIANKLAPSQPPSTTGPP